MVCIICTAVRFCVWENSPLLILLTVGKVILVLSNIPSIAPIMMNPFMLVIKAVRTTEVSPDWGEEMVMIGVVYIWISVLSQ